MPDIVRTEIALSKSKLTKLLLFCILFLGAGLWMLIAQPQTSNVVFNSPVVRNGAGILGVVMGLFGIYFFSKKLLDRQPGLIIDEDGLTDNTSAFTFGHIPWADVSEVCERVVQASAASKQRFVTIRLKDPAPYILREPNAMKRKLLQLNAKNYGSPVHVSANNLQIKHADLLALITTAFKHWRER